MQEGGQAGNDHFDTTKRASQRRTPPLQLQGEIPFVSQKWLDELVIPHSNFLGSGPVALGFRNQAK